MATQMNGSHNDYLSGVSLGPKSNSSSSDILLLSPQFGPGSSGNQGDLSNMHLTMATMSMSLETLGLDMSLEEAVNKVRDLTKENAELRESVQQTNITMKQQYQILTDWKQKWEEEREQVRQKHEQARTVVTSLREEVKKKDENIRRMELELIQYEEKANHSAPSVKAELLSLEQVKGQLEKRCMDYQGQIAALQEEIQSLKNSRDDQCNENDKYLKIVTEKEDRINGLERANEVLNQEVGDAQKFRESHSRLEEQKKGLVAENKRLMEQLQQLRTGDDTDLGVADMSMQSGFVHVDPEETGLVVSDSVPFTDPQPTQNQERVLCAAIPVYAPKKEAEPGYPTKQIAETQREGPGVGEVIQKLQDEIHSLRAQIQHKNQEMEALHRKVHSTEELLADKEHKLNVKLTQLKVENEQREEALRVQVEEARARGGGPHSPRTPVGSMDSQHPSHSEEDLRALRTQVTSLVSELQGANDRIKYLDELCQRQKQRVQLLETTLESQYKQVESERQRDEALIETLRVTISRLEGQLSGERTKWQAKETASDRLSREYTKLFQQYQETAKQNEAFKKELQQRMSMSMSQDTSRIYEERIDNLTAQLITAEESMHEMKQENLKLKDQMQKMGGEVDMMEALRAQAEVYKTDFEAERSSREKLHEEKEVLKEENNQLHLRNQQLQEELSHLSENQIAEMQRRHGQGSGGGGFTSQVRNLFGVGGRNNPPPGDYMYADGLRQEPRAPPREDMPPPLPPARESLYEEYVPRQVPTEDPSDPQLVCPMCQEQSPDIDTLQLHVIDCIK